jgi:hypothetical protein
LQAFIFWTGYPREQMENKTDGSACTARQFNPLQSSAFAKLSQPQTSFLIFKTMVAITLADVVPRL